MTRVVLEPRLIAEYCFLQEAIDYRVSHTIPLAPNFETNGHPTYDRDAQKTIIPSPLPDHRRQRTGFNSEWLGKETQEIVGNDVWLEQLEGRTKAEIFQALCDGRLTARGRRFSGRVSRAEIEAVKSDARFDSDCSFETIKPEFWRFDGIRWNRSMAIEWFDGVAFFHIQLLFEEVLKLFPLQLTTHFDQAHLWQRYLIFDPSSEEPKQEKLRGKRGPKRKYDREAIENEAVRRLLLRHSYKSLEDLVGDLRAWCSKLDWKDTPTESTIRGYVGRFYSIYKETEGEV